MSRLGRLVNKVLGVAGVRLVREPHGVAPVDEYELAKSARALGVKVGEHVRFADGMPSFGSEPYLVEIGDDCVLSGRVTFLTHDGGIRVCRDLVEDYASLTKFARVRVGRGCFVGAFAVILPGVTIGDGCVIGAASVVTKSVPPGEVWAGNPAKFVCTTADYARRAEARSRTPEQEALRREVKARRGYA